MAHEHMQRIARAAVGALLCCLATTARSGHAAGSWPSPNAYCRAMSCGNRYILDPRLRGARVRADARGNPICYTGSFSSVYKIATASGRRIALRVFHPAEEVAERQDIGALGARYQKLGSYLQALAAKKRIPPEIVEFAWVQQGVLVEGKDLPILKMPWLEGRTLDNWMARRLKQGRAKALLTLASNWRAMCRDLSAVHVAHGDLHHGNILIEPSGQMRLIDYDGMYTPPLAGMTNSEIGHPNYQHPRFHFPRPQRRPFDEHMDRFSSIVIYLSLLAVGKDPRLWTRFHKREDPKLIFEGQDFVDPARSPVFAAVKASPDRTVRGLANLLAHLCVSDPHTVPSLEQALANVAADDKPWWHATP